VIDPRHLRTLRALADHGTVNAAAVALHLTPSAVSQQLTVLAKTTGCVLIERRGRGVVLTEPARILLDHADAILERYERADAELRDFRAGTAARFRICAFPTAIAGFVARAVARLGADNPGWRVEIEEAESEESLALLLDGEADVAVVMVAPNRPVLADSRIVLEPLVVDDYRAVVPAGHRLAARAEPVDLGELAEEPWIQSRRWTSCHEVTAAACAAAGFQPRAAHHTTDFLAAVGMVAAGLGVTVIPEMGLPPILPNTVRVLPIGPDAPRRRIVAAVRKGSNYSRTVRALREASASAKADAASAAQAVSAGNK
jgi:DNA-binding transcriptional LysR family regulator